jgi:hypothetical protein
LHNAKVALPDDVDAIEDGQVMSREEQGGAVVGPAVVP